MDDERHRIAQYEVWSVQLRTLRRHLSAMQTSLAQLSHCAGQLEVTRPTATRAYAWYGMGMLADLHETAMDAIVKERDFSVHTLAINAIRLAVNAMYVLADTQGDRLTGAMRQHFDAEHARLLAWLAVAPGQETAAARMQFLLAYRQLQPWYADAPVWPPLGARADAIGMGEWVHPVLARVADAEDLLAQRMMSFLESEQKALTECEAAHTYRTAQAEASAQYVQTVALRLFAAAMHRTATAFGDRVAMTVAESSIEQLDNIMADHNTLEQKQRSSQNIYLRF